MIRLSVIRLEVAAVHVSNRCLNVYSPGLFLRMPITKLMTFEKMEIFSSVDLPTFKVESRLSFIASE